MKIKSKYSDLIIYFLFLKGFVLKDSYVCGDSGVVIVKDLSYREFKELEGVDGVWVITNNFYDFEWGKMEIVEWVVADFGLKFSNERKEYLVSLSDFEWEKVLKYSVFLKNNIFDGDLDVNFFNLFSSIDLKREKSEIYFKLLNKYQPEQVYSALNSFIFKCFDSRAGVVADGYYRVIYSKRSRIVSNYGKAVKRLSELSRLDISSDFLVYSFLMDL